jgi:hypothetical protein
MTRSRVNVSRGREFGEHKNGKDDRWHFSALLCTVGLR